MIRTPAIWPLRPHRDCDAVPLDRLEVKSVRTAPLQWRFCFGGAGDMARVRFPSPETSSRGDGLWKHTCCEVFLMDDGGRYCEFNFSPSTQWAAYRFDSYRSGMKAQGLASAPRIEFTRTPDLFVLDAEVDLTGVFEAQARSLRMGLAAVIEHSDGEISYWALAHAPGKPDFHYANSFVGVLRDNGS